MLKNKLLVGFRLPAGLVVLHLGEEPLVHPGGDPQALGRLRSG